VARDGQWKPAWKKAKARWDWTSTRHARGAVGIIIWRRVLSRFTFWFSSNSSLKKLPALTIEQAHELVAQVLREDIKLLPDVLGIVDYRQHHNHAAYRSHRKRTLERHRKASRRKKGKVS
jgi:hypothetical protein